MADGAFRITESRRFTSSGPAGGYMYPQKYLYDNDVSFLREWKKKKKGALKWGDVIGKDNILLVAEKFTGKKWVEIDRWVGPDV